MEQANSRFGDLIDLDIGWGLGLRSIIVQFRSRATFILSVSLKHDLISSHLSLPVLFETPTIAIYLSHEDYDLGYHYINCNNMANFEAVMRVIDHLELWSKPTSPGRF